MSLKKYVADNSDKVERILSRVEIAGLLATLVSVLLMSNKVAGSDMMLIIGLSTLASVYILLSYIATALYRLEESKFFSIGLRISYTALTVMMMGILFMLMRWPGGNTMINIGCAVTGIMFLYFTYKMYFGKLDDEAHRVIINNLVVRMLPALLVAAFLIALYLKT